MVHSGKRFERFVLACVPAFITLLLAIFYMASKHIAGLDRFMPILPLIPVFYWGMRQTKEIPYWFVCFVGIVIDAVSGQPLGVTSLTYLFFMVAVLSQRKYVHKEGFVIKWFFFSAILVVSELFGWGVISAFYSRAQPLGTACIQWLLTMCCYPFLHKVFDGLYESIQIRHY